MTRPEAEAKLAEAQAREAERRAAAPDRVRDALRALVDRLDFVHADDRYRTVWTCNQIRFGPYTGPDYIAELGAARAALAPPPPAGPTTEPELPRVGRKP